MNFDEEISERERTDETVHDFGLELFSINGDKLRADKTMDVFFSDRFGDKFGIFFFIWLIIIERVNEFLVRSTILDLIDSAIEWIILDA